MTKANGMSGKRRVVKVSLAMVLAAGLGTVATVPLGAVAPAVAYADPSDALEEAQAQEGSISIEGKDGTYKTVAEAVANASAGETIKLGAGTYDITSRIEKAVNFEGSGTETTTIYGQILYGNGNFETASGGNQSLKVSDLTIEYSADILPSADTGIILNGAGVSTLNVNNVTIEGFKFGINLNGKTANCTVSAPALKVSGVWCAIGIQETGGNKLGDFALSSDSTATYAVQGFGDRNGYYPTVDDYSKDTGRTNNNGESITMPTTGETENYSYVATVGYTRYANLQDAFDKAPAGATVELAQGVIDLNSYDKKKVNVHKPLAIVGSNEGDGTTIKGALWVTGYDSADAMDSTVTLSNIDFVYLEGCSNQGVCVNDPDVRRLNVEDCSFTNYVFAIGNGGTHDFTLAVENVTMNNVWCGVGFQKFSGSIENTLASFNITDDSTVVYEVQGFGSETENGTTTHNGYYINYKDYVADKDNTNNNGLGGESASIVPPKADVGLVPTYAEQNSYEATLNGFPYESLEDAVANASAGDTITLQKDVELTKRLAITKGVTLDLNKHTISAAGDFTKDAGSNTNNQLVSIDGATGVIVKNGTIEAGPNNYHALNVWNSSKVTLDGLTLDHSQAYGGAPLIVGASDVTLAGETTFVVGNNSWYAGNVDSRDVSGTKTAGSIATAADTTLTFKGVGQSLVNGICIENTAAAGSTVAFGENTVIIPPAGVSGFKPVYMHEGNSGSIQDAVKNPENAGIGFNQNGTSHVHSLNATPVPYKAPTATKPGNYAYWVCNTCHKLFKDAACTQETTLSEMTIPATGVVKPTYATTVSKAEHGTVKVTPERAKAGDDVTITATPDEGFKVSKVSVADKDGKELKVAANADGTYTFEMPSGGATVTVEFSCDGGELCPSRGLVDVDPGEWYHDAVDWAVKNGVMTGYDDGSHKFGPDDPLTRAQLAATLYKKAGQPAVDGSKVEAYSDCDADAWYAKAVAWATEQGLMTGYSDGSGRFAPDAELTREQLAIVFWRIAGEPAAEADLAQFPDGSETSPWAEDAVEWAVSTGLLKGYDNTGELDPAGSLTRAQTATVFMREADAD
ncbi:S-layer homology domain-containing protein [Collinsella sp. An2]|uniref:S-layer homology domain-containing protein n=1 Tax=Collinsella sp. An2 TaxID=1965585 RepID=UPI0013027F66|nr:S-layer homology domain-containing protein [Collinsella sp. An2]